MPVAWPKWLEDAKLVGEDLGVYARDSSADSGTKGKDRHLPVFHKFMAKYLSEDSEGGISMIGTMIQQVAGANNAFKVVAAEDDGDAAHFKFDKFRVNDASAGKFFTCEDQIDLRRSVPVPHFGTRSTYNCTIPMNKDSVFTIPPYEITRCHALIELQTSSLKYTDTKEKTTKTSNVRPNIYLNSEDERELFVCRKPADLNRTSSYCPKYEVSFFLEKPALAGMITTFAPLLFVALLSILNVMNADGEGPALDNSISLALTVVFVLPALQVQGRGNTGTSFVDYIFDNNVIIFFLFLGMAFTSLRLPRFFDEAAQHENADLYLPFGGWWNNNSVVAAIGSYGAAEASGLLGSICFLISFLIPVGNYIRYRSFKQKIINSGYLVVGERGASISRAAFDKKKDGVILDASSKRLAFGKDSSYDQWELADAEKEAESAGKAKEGLNADKVDKALSENLNSMHSVDSVYNQLKAGERKTVVGAAGGEVDWGEGKPSPFWKMDENDITLSCGVEYN
eukprot:gene10757-31660_t